MIRTVARVLPIVLFATLMSAQQIQVRMNSRLSSETAKTGTPFEAILMAPVRLGGQDCAKGSPVGGVVTEAKSSGRLSSPGVLQLQPTWVSCHGRRVAVTAEPLVLEGRSHTKNNAVLIGGGAAAGAILGSNYRLPPGLAKQGKIPPGHARKMAQAQAIPYECTSELSPIPSGWERVIFDARVILYDATHREIDSFVWQRND
jgi:hypothetical protein